MLGKKYNSSIANQKYDVLIIGSGVSGLCTAALLSKIGKKVLLIEKHHIIGGYTHMFKRKGYEWDVGIHYIGEVHRDNSTGRRIFDLITDGKLKWAGMGNPYDRIVFPDQSYDFCAPKEVFVDCMIKEFPKDESAIQQYMNLLDQVSQAKRKFFVNKALPPLYRKITYPLVTKQFLKFSSRTTRDVISELSGNERLLGVLTGQWGDLGLPPGSSSFVMQAMVAHHYLDGGNYPVGGAKSIAAATVPVIEGNGGTVIFNAGVDEILIRDDQACGVRLENGDEVEASLIVSSAGVVNTFGKFLRNYQQELGIQTKLAQVHPSSGHFCLHIGIKESARALGLNKTNLWVYPSYNHDGNVESFLSNQHNDFPVVFISFPSVKDPSWETHRPGTSTIEAITMASYNWFDKWKDLPWKRRGQEYEDYKENISSRLLEIIYQHVPSIKGKVDYYELSTPLSTRDMANYPTGELYGIDHTPSRFQLRWLKPDTPIKKLFLTGQDILTVGVTSSLMSGLLTCSAVLKRNLVKDMMAGKI